MGGGGQGGATGDFQAVTAQVVHAQNATCIAQAGFLEGFIARIRSTTGTIHRESCITRDDKGAAESDALQGGERVAVTREEKAPGGVDRARVIADDKGAETGFVDLVGNDGRCGVTDRDGHLRGRHRRIPDRWQRGCTIEG